MARKYTMSFDKEKYTACYLLYLSKYLLLMNITILDNFLVKTSYNFNKAEILFIKSIDYACKEIIKLP